MNFYKLSYAIKRQIIYFFKKYYFMCIACECLSKCLNKNVLFATLDEKVYLYDFGQV